MAPLKVSNENQNAPQGTGMLAKLANRVSTRSQSNNISSVFNKKMNLKDLTKRKADQLSPPKGKTTKRSAFSDLTNAGNAAKKDEKKTTIVVKKQPPQTLVSSQVTIQKKEVVKIVSTAQAKLPMLVKTTSSKTVAANVEAAGAVAVVGGKAAAVGPLLSKERRQLIDAKFDSIYKLTASAKVTSRFRQSLNSSQEKSDESSLYTSALEDMSPKAADVTLDIITPVKRAVAAPEPEAKPGVPEGVEDFDKENEGDPMQVAGYAMDIFQYMKDREAKFRVDDYMNRQVLLSRWMRSLLVNWMVDVQENFELNHETLYLAVKIIDMYLSKVLVSKDVLQLVGTAALFIASKYDERMPPLIDDFVYICKEAFTRDDVINMEMDVFRVINYNLGVPLSYRFLRRFARCCKATMPTLTLARFILELSLMEYHFIFLSESKMACAALYLALRMQNVSQWTPCLVYYTGYKLQDFRAVSLQLNAMLKKEPRQQIMTVRNKYSHEIFFEVAKVPLISDDNL